MPPQQALQKFNASVPDELLLSRLCAKTSVEFHLPLYEQLANVCTDASAIRWAMLGQRRAHRGYAMSSLCIALSCLICLKRQDQGVGYSSALFTSFGNLIKIRRDEVATYLCAACSHAIEMGCCLYVKSTAAERLLFLSPSGC